MIALLSVWSADARGLETTIGEVDREVDGYHVDVMDGRLVDRTLFGPVTVERVRRLTDRPIEVHLMVARAERCVEDYVRAGADIVTVHRASCARLGAVIDAIADAGADPGLAIGTDEPVELAGPYLGRLRHVLVMGTALGVKGAPIDGRTYQRVRRAHDLCRRVSRPPAVVVDGGIRATTAPRLAAAGADGVVPGSLVLSSPEPVARLRWLQGLTAARSEPPTRAFPARG